MGIYNVDLCGWVSRTKQRIIEFHKIWGKFWRYVNLLDSQEKLCFIKFFILLICYSGSKWVKIKTDF
jgi:hypothetical protein